MSFLVPVFNEEDYIAGAIKSILDYDYGLTKVEVVVVDDNSSDNTHDSVDRLRFEYQDNSLKLYRNDGKGKNAAFNLAFENSSGEFICFMGGDDLLVPESLDARISPLREIVYDATPSLCVTLCKIKTFSSERKKDGILIPRKKGVGSQSGGAVTLPRLLANKVFPLPLSLPNEDTWVSLFLDAFDVKKVHVDAVGLNYRIHSGNSHSRDFSFPVARSMILDRQKAPFLFYCRYDSLLPESGRRFLVKRILIAACIHLGVVFPLLLIRGVSVREKLGAIQYIVRPVYFIKKRFYKLIAGR
ncbi:glycosyltransferase family 2 protein [Chromohalobacter nigrandesensis]|uniref:glycosyltransferase family 2 protein n=1 Tax=Chromohalobacter nigrandesensis TaxID=119863 RepID=UPI001FF3EA42|nr:glycosyltransferase [Chromohalobacter nigrandesensis]